MKRRVLYLCTVLFLGNVGHCQAEVGGNGAQLLDQDTAGVYGAAEERDRFGSSIASGDFNHDGIKDLVVGVPRESVGSITRGGIVQVFYGTTDGISTGGQQLWNQNSDGVAGRVENGDSFGYSLAVADFNNDEYDDLAIGVEGEEIGDVGCGAVAVLYGSGDGLAAEGNQLWHQDSPGILGACEEGDSFGRTLVAGYFDGDLFADLAVGIPYESIGDVESAGAVAVIYGSALGLNSENNQLWHQNSRGLDVGAEARNHFGFSLAAGDFNTDGIEDLAVGAPDDNVGRADSAGAVHVLYGRYNGLSTIDNQLWHQDVDGIQGQAETDDNFGYALTAGDYDNNGYDDLAIGVRGEKLTGSSGSGVVSVINGSYGGLIATNNLMLRFDTTNSENGISSSYGYRLETGNFNDDQYDDLVVSYEHFLLDKGYDVGALSWYRGGLNSVLTARGLYFHLSFVDAEPELPRQCFGCRLAAGDFDGDSIDDLAVGAPRREINGNRSAGQVVVFFSDGQ